MIRPSARRCSPGRPALLLGELTETSAFDTSFSMLHGLYWMTMNLAEDQPLLIVVDDAHWADEPSLRWLAHLAPRLEGPEVGLIVPLRPVDLAVAGGSRARCSTPRARCCARSC